MSRAEDDAYFNADILEALAYASRLAEWKTCDTACRENALTELCFNMRGRWLGFILARRAWQNREWQTAHDELLNSDWAREVQPHGLDTPGRATRIAGYVLTGVYP